MSFSIQRYHDFSYGHTVTNHESSCAHLHGHNGRIHFYVKAAVSKSVPGEVLARQHQGLGDLDSVGRVLDFSVLKARLCEWVERNWDHKFLVYEKDERAEAIQAMDPEGTVVVPFNPTAENMAHYIVTVIAPQVLEGTNTVCYRVDFEETRKCSVTYSL